MRKHQLTRNLAYTKNAEPPTSGENPLPCPEVQHSWAALRLEPPASNVGPADWSVGPTSKEDRPVKTQDSVVGGVKRFRHTKDGELEF